MFSNSLMSFENERNMNTIAMNVIFIYLKIELGEN